MNDENIFSDEPIMYSSRQLNELASAILSDLTESGAISFEDGLGMKQFFNTLMDLIVNDKEECDEILEAIKEIYKNNSMEDILKAAEAVRDCTLEKDISDKKEYLS